MFGFLQGFAYGLYISFIPWFVMGMIKPSLALPTSPAFRWQAIVRYLFITPSVATLCWLTSLWGGFDPSFAGWIVGLLAIPGEIFIERRWRHWRGILRERQNAAESARRLKTLEQEAFESGLRILNPDRPPENADAVVQALCEAKKTLQHARRPDLAVQADRLFTRYEHIQTVLRDKFDPRELTYERAFNLVAEVCRSALDTLSAMGSLAQGTMNIDADFARRRLAQEPKRLSEEERQALSRRLALLEDTNRRLLEMSARNEAALTTLDDAAVAISGIETNRSQATVAAEQALLDLRRFANQAQRYGREL